MLKQFTNKKGFTLIELLIVVAIIGILAAIAIPQFNAYRQRGYNSAAVSDLRNMKTAQEALQADQQVYGEMSGVPVNATTAPVVLANLTAGPAATDTLQAGLGPAMAATANTAGAQFSTTITPVGGAPVPVGSGFSVSNGVWVQALSFGGAVPASPTTYTIATRHNQSDTAFLTEAETTLVLKGTNSGFRGTTTPFNAAIVATNAQNYGQGGANATLGGATLISQ